MKQTLTFKTGLPSQDFKQDYTEQLDGVELAGDLPQAFQQDPWRGINSLVPEKDNYPRHDLDWPTQEEISEVSRSQIVQPGKPRQIEVSVEISREPPSQNRETDESQETVHSHVPTLSGYLQLILNIERLRKMIFGLFLR